MFPYPVPVLTTAIEEAIAEVEPACHILRAERGLQTSPGVLQPGGLVIALSCVIQFSRLLAVIVFVPAGIEMKSPSWPTLIGPAKRLRDPPRNGPSSAPSGNAGTI
jgi:hypothetical protein